MLIPTKQMKNEKPVIRLCKHLIFSSYNCIVWTAHWAWFGKKTPLGEVALNHTGKITDKFQPLIKMHLFEKRNRKLFFNKNTWHNYWHLCIQYNLLFYFFANKTTQSFFPIAFYKTGEYRAEL